MRLLLCLLSLPLFAETPPAGFRSLFNGKDLSGWHGLNPHQGPKLTGEKKAADLAKQRADFPQHWRVENGELVNAGTGPYATTDEDFGDIELRIEYKTVAKADSGIYLRGTRRSRSGISIRSSTPRSPTVNRTWVPVVSLITPLALPDATRS